MHQGAHRRVRLCDDRLTRGPLRRLSTGADPVDRERPQPTSGRMTRDTESLNATANDQYVGGVGHG
jgi:hypothetical protein